MFVSGMNPFSSLVFSFPTLIITIPATIMTLIWLGSLYGSSLRINAASLFCPGLHLDVRERRRQRILPGAALDRYLSCTRPTSWSGTSTW